MLSSYLRFFIENRLIAWWLMLLLIGWGLITSPFDLGWAGLPRAPVAVDAIPDIGENQQIIFTSWPGRSPQDVEDQITYPLSTMLLGIPGIKSVRSNSMFGFSSIYLIFDEGIDFYWSRSRILEKLNALPSGLLPADAQPSLGPDATALGQIFWYTLEGRDAEGIPTGGWDLQELRSLQDYYVRYALAGAEGVAEVASIGGFVKEYQIDLKPEAMQAYGIALPDVLKAVKESNLDVGAQTMEYNLVEYFVRGLGYVKRLEDLEQAVVRVRDNVPIRLGDIAHVHLGPASRRGILDKSGAEAVGGVVVARYGTNPLEVIQQVKQQIEQLQPGLPTKTLADGRVSQVQVVPFYDRTHLIQETIGTLEEALSLEILITFIVVVLMLFNLRPSLLVGSTLPVAVLMCFIAMKHLGVDANIVALSGIAIAIGTMVDMSIVLTENIVQRLEVAPDEQPLVQTIFEATQEVGSAVLTAVATTVISFLPVFTMEAAEGKLFRPLAYTKTFALVAAIVVALTFLPAMAHALFSIRVRRSRWRMVMYAALMLLGLGLSLWLGSRLPLLLCLVGLAGTAGSWWEGQHPTQAPRVRYLQSILYALILSFLLTRVWMPLGVSQSIWINLLFVVSMVAGFMGFFYLVTKHYASMLRVLLRAKAVFLLVAAGLIGLGGYLYLNTGREFMPSLDEGSFLLMPTAMPHAGMQENLKNLRYLDMAVTAIPEVETVVGKAGRVESALDPAPMSMYENVILYKSEYKTDEQGHRLRFRVDAQTGEYVRDGRGKLIPDPKGQYYRQWRDHIHSPDDIWQEIVEATRFPGVTSAPKLQPIETRLVMLQTGMRAPMGIKIRGNELKTLEAFGFELERALKEVEGVQAASVFAERIIGKPYLLLKIQRDAIARHGLSIEQVQRYLQATVGGMALSKTVEGRERYDIRVRYPRELRDDPDKLKRIYVPTATGEQVPLGELIHIEYEQGPQAIKSEDGFLVSYVLFDKAPGLAEVEVVERAQAHLNQLIREGALVVPAGLRYEFAGNYQQQLRANRRLALVVPLALVLIFLILYLQFRSVALSLMVFVGVAVAFSGGCLLIGLYGQSWFLNLNFLGTNLRDLFQVHPINLSVAVNVGFLALFGIATDDGVLVGTYLRDKFRLNRPSTVEEIREAVLESGLRRVRPAMMTTATTLLALLPVLTSTGRGSDIMIPMALPTFGGMLLQVLTMFTVPVLYAGWQETRLAFSSPQVSPTPSPPGDAPQSNDAS